MVMKLIAPILFVATAVIALTISVGAEQPSHADKPIMAFGGGVLLFFSPCVLLLIPSYVSYITGISFEDLTGEQDRGRIRKTTLKSSKFFIAGFSLIFILLGASSSFLGRLERHCCAEVI